MNKKQAQEIISVSKLMGSPKRMLMLEMISKGPTGYRAIERGFEKIGKVCNSGEMYVHIKKLLKEGHIVRRPEKRDYVITKKGLATIEKIKEIANTEPKEPKVRWEF